jgi:hypothetical protein
MMGGVYPQGVLLKSALLIVKFESHLQLQESKPKVQKTQKKSINFWQDKAPSQTYNWAIEKSRFCPLNLLNFQNSLPLSF